MPRGSYQIGQLPADEAAIADAHINHPAVLVVQQSNGGLKFIPVGATAAQRAASEPLWSWMITWNEMVHAACAMAADVPVRSRR